MNDLVNKLKEYLKHPSTDGKPIRQQLRKELKELIDKEEQSYIDWLNYKENKTKKL